MFVKGVYIARMKYINGSSRQVSLDSSRIPGLTQQSFGGKGGSWKYGSGPRLDGTIARHLEVYNKGQHIPGWTIDRLAYITDNPQALKTRILNMRKLHSKRLSGVMQNPLWMAPVVLKCNIHNADAITFCCKIVFTSEIITLDVVILRAT